MNLPFEVGIDIVSVRRMGESIERHGKRFLDRIFTPAEQSYCETKRNRYESYAARFAAKEAVIKAKGGGKGRWRFHDIEVKRGKRGEPFISLTPAARKQLGIKPSAQFKLSLAHERDFAIATVLMTAR